MERKYGRSPVGSDNFPWYNPDWPEKMWDCGYRPKEKGNKPLHVIEC